MTDIPLRWVGTDATGAAAASVKKNIDSVGKAATGAQGGVKGLTSAMSSMAPAGKTAQGALSGMESAAQKLLGGLGGVAAAMGVGAVVGFGGMMLGAAVDMGKAADASDRLRSSFDGLAAGAGVSSSEIMTRLKQASGGAIAEYDLMLAANKAMILGVADSADEMGKLMEIARTRGAAMGLSATQAFNDLVTGLGRGSALILDNLGIVVDAEATNAAYAESIGKTVAQLTEQEKKQALVNATLKEATGAALPAASAYEQMGAGMADLKIAFGELVSPVIVGGVNALSEAVKNLNESIANEKQINIGANLADSAIQFDTVLSTYTTRLEQWKANAAALEAFNGVKIEFPTFEGIPAFDDQLGMAYQSLKGVAERYNETARAMGGALIDIEQLKNGVVAYQEVEQAIKDVATAAADSAAVVVDRSGQLASIQEAYRGVVQMQDEIAAAAERAGLSMAQTDAVMAQAAAQYAILTANGVTSADAIAQVTAAMDAQMERLPALGELLSILANKLATEIPAAAAVAAEAVASMFASVMAGMADMGQQLMRSGPGSTTGDPGRVTRGRDTVRVNSPNIGASTLDQFDGMALMSTKAADAARAASKLATSGSGAAGKLGDLAGKAGDLAGKFQGILDKIPGLKGTSEVSEKQMEDAKLGIPQNFADDYLRRLTDEVLNGVDWAGVDIGDAAQRAGIDPNLPAQTILAMFKNAWADSSLFANPANLDLINMDAVKAGLTQANNAQSGKANIDALASVTTQPLRRWPRWA